MYAYYIAVHTFGLLYSSVPFRVSQIELHANSTKSLNRRSCSAISHRCAAQHAKEIEPTTTQLSAAVCFARQDDESFRRRPLRLISLYRTHTQHITHHSHVPEPASDAVDGCCNMREQWIATNNRPNGDGMVEKTHSRTFAFLQNMMAACAPISFHYLSRTCARSRICRSIYDCMLRLGWCDHTKCSLYNA